MKSNAYHLHQGYSNLKNENKLDFLLKLKHKIQDCELQEIFRSPFILRAISQDTEIIVRQFLVSILLGNEFNKKILIFLSNKKKNYISITQAVEKDPRRRGHSSKPLFFKCTVWFSCIEILYFLLF